MRALWMASGSGLSSTGSPGCPRSASTPYPRRYRQTDRTHTPSSPPAPARSQSDPDPVRQPDSNPTPYPHLPAAFPVLRPHPLRTLHPTFPLAASESCDGGAEESVESVPSLRFNAEFSNSRASTRAIKPATNDASSSHDEHPAPACSTPRSSHRSPSELTPGPPQTCWSTGPLNGHVFKASVSVLSELATFFSDAAT